MGDLDTRDDDPEPLSARAERQSGSVEQHRRTLGAHVHARQQRVKTIGQRFGLTVRQAIQCPEQTLRWRPR